jgi:hypothetical protein
LVLLWSKYAIGKGDILWGNILLLVAFANLFSASSTSSEAIATRFGFVSALIALFSSSFTFCTGLLSISTIFLVKLLEFKVPPRVVFGTKIPSAASNESGSTVVPRDSGAVDVVVLARGKVEAFLETVRRLSGALFG